MATSQHAAPIMPPGGQWCDANGDPLNGGKVNVYIAGSSTPETSYPTYDDALAGTNANQNPVVLSAAGRAQIWLQSDPTSANPSRLYKIAVTDSADVSVQTMDDYSPALASPAPAISEWVKETTAVAYSSTVLFTVTGVDKTATYHKGRRVKLVVTAGTIYGIVTDSTFATNTTVRVATQDGSTLDSGLSAVYYSLASSPYQATSPSSLGERVSFVKVYGGDAQAITTGGARKIEFDTKTTDALSEYDAVTNYRYTPTGQSAVAITGRGWLMTAHVTLTSSITSAVLEIKRNGTTTIATAKANQGIAGSSIEATCMEEDQGSTGNYYEVFVTPSGNTDVTAGADKTYFHIRRL